MKYTGVGECRQTSWGDYAMILDGETEGEDVKEIDYPVVPQHVLDHLQKYHDQFAIFSPDGFTLVYKGILSYQAEPPMPITSWFACILIDKKTYYDVGTGMDMIGHFPFAQMCQTFLLDTFVHAGYTILVPEQAEDLHYHLLTSCIVTDKGYDLKGHIPKYGQVLDQFIAGDVLVKIVDYVEVSERKRVYNDHTIHDSMQYLNQGIMEIVGFKLKTLRELCHKVLEKIDAAEQGSLVEAHEFADTYEQIAAILRKNAM